MAALIVLRDRAINATSAVRSLANARAQNPTTLDTHFQTIRIAMQEVFSQLDSRMNIDNFSGIGLKGLRKNRKHPASIEKPRIDLPVIAALRWRLL